MSNLSSDLQPGRRTILGISMLMAMLSSYPLRPARAAGEFKDRGFLLPSGAVKIDDDRYRLPMGWDDALRFYRTNYPPAKFARHTLRNQNGVRALHLANPRSGDEWIGANMYEAARGEVRLYVIGNGDAAEDADGK